MTAKKRIISLFVALAMVFTMAFSVLYIVRQTDHECTGVDCHICQQVNFCIKHLNDITPKPQNALLIAALLFALVTVIGAIQKYADTRTLIDLKVKLSN